MAAFFGCLYAGAIAVPAYPPRRNRLLTRLQAIVADAQASFAVTTQAMLRKMESLFVQTPGLDALRWMTTDDLARPCGRLAEPETNQNTLAFIQYTSGSTSIPKGVMVSHGTLAQRGDDTGRFSADGELDHRRLAADLSRHGADWECAASDVRRQQMHLDVARFISAKPLRWLQAISRYRRRPVWPNFAYELCVRKITPEQRALLDLSSWKVAFNGAEPVKAETLRNFAIAFEPSGL